MELLKDKTVTRITQTKTYQTSKDGLVVVETIVDGGKSDFRLEGFGPDGSRPYIVNEDFWFFIKENNPYQQVRIDGKNVNGFDLIENKEELSLEFIQKVINLELIIYINYSNHCIFDIDKNIIPLAVTYDYIGTYFSTEYIKDLDVFLIHLKKHNWVVNKEELTIEDFPYYNVPDGDSSMQYISVKIRPDKGFYINEYNKYKDSDRWSIEMKNYVTSYKITKDFDPLGALQFFKEEHKIENTK